MVQATTFNISSALADPNGSDYALVIRDLDAIATQLKRIQAAGIPLLWRPLHEAEGGWVCYAFKSILAHTNEVHSSGGEHKVLVLARLCTASCTTVMSTIMD